MNFVRDLFGVNHEIIYFIYGLTFFILGLAIALQSRHSSRLELARSLTWLAAFGFLHGFHEWGDLFIPLQAVYLAPGLVRVLHYIHILLLAASFTCLYGFGLALLEPLRHRRVLHISFAVLLLGWVLLIVFPFRTWFPDFDTWHNAANALARYFIGLPSGLLAAFALREHAYKRIVPYNVPRIFRAMQLSGITMAVYALAAGMIVPPVPFFPGNWLNSDTFTRYLVVPPQLVRGLIGLVMTATTIRFLEIFDIETARRIEAMQQQQMLADERERIARELHDGTIQKVYTAALLVRSAQNLAAAESPVAGRLGTAVGVLDDAIGDLRHNLGQLHERNPSPEPLKQALENLAADPRFSSLVTIDLDLALPEPCLLTAEQQVHVLAILQETLANVVRHARARHVSLAADCRNRRLHIAVRDDGIGMPTHVAEGHGIRNMRDRAALLHGQLVLEKLERGTCVTLEFPWEERT
jgi:signal transduction histidine kinase